MSNATIVISELCKRKEFELLAAEWNHCLAASPENAVYLRHEWFTAWYESDPDGRPFRIILAREGDRLVGMAALSKGILTFKRFNIPTIQSAADGLTPRYAIIAEYNRRDVFTALAEHLLRNPDPERHGNLLAFNFLNLAVDSAAARLWTETWRDLGRSVYFEAGRTSPYLPIPEDCTDFEELWRTLCSHHQQSVLRRKLRRCRREGGRVEQVRSPERAREILPTLYKVSARSWKRRKSSDILSSERTVRFYDAFTPLAAERGWLNLWVLWRGDDCAAFQYDLEYKGISTALRSDFDLAASSLSPGLVLRWHMMLDFVARGGREFDFGGQAYDFKRYWTSHRRRHVRLIIPAPGILSRATLLARNHPVMVRIRKAAPEGGIPFRTRGAS
ncbi:MAG: GNAT family N-acetyltransferase [bacterium]|nr:GNAT family N-acetyltransferase [bacterium]